MPEKTARQSVQEALDAMGIAYHACEHEPILTVAEGKRIAARQGAACCKTLLLKTRRAFFLLLLPADKKLASKELAKTLGCGHLSFASAQELDALLHTFAGAVSVLGLLFDTERRVQVLIDEDILRAEWIDCHPCTNDCSLKIAVRDILDTFLPRVGHGWRPVALPA